MNDNITINDHTNYGVDFTGPHAVIQHQHYQMVYFLMQHCRRSMCGINPCALPCVPSQYREIEIKNRNQEDKDRKPNLAQSKQGWKTQNKNKGKRSNNKQIKEETTDVHENRFRWQKTCPK